ncbi:hypothetical protein ACSTEA_00075 [Vibrio vulnificus]|uniref:hypothetical protein n=1 Tax=Vibrio vulnificus TaxID=672 RepID=UPI003ED9A836
MTNTLQKEALVQLKVDQGKVNLSPMSYAQFFEGLRQQLHRIFENDFQTECSITDDTDHLMKLAAYREMSIVVIDGLIFSEMETKCRYISKRITAITTKPTYESLSIEEVNFIVISMLFSARSIFINNERKALDQVEAEEIADKASAKLANTIGKQILDVLSNISFKSEPENTYELTDTPSCCH